MNLLVLSTYDISPVSDGGKARYVNLYGHLSRRHNVTVLAYDDRCDATRTYRLADRFKVVAPARSIADRDRLSDAGERTKPHIHDVLCIREYQFSPQFFRVLEREAARADVMIASHPYLAPVAFGRGGRRMTRIYEAHNVEYDGKSSYFADTPDRILSSLLDDVRQAERLACIEADYVTAVSDEDADRLAELYDIPRGKITIVPNGVDVAAYPQPDAADTAALRAHLQIGIGPLAIFVGSGHAPNVEAYVRARAMLAAAGYCGHVIVIGSVVDGLPPGLPPVMFGERFLGVVDEAVKTALLIAADFAVHLMFGGAGTNLKLFEYMAARTLVVANAFGRRGVPFDGWYWPVETVQELTEFLRMQPWNTPDGQRIFDRARAIAEEHYDWRRIAAGYRRLIERGRGGAVAP